MPKARTLDSDFWDDPEAAGLGRDARLLLIGLITICADDHGRLLAHPAYLRKHVFGYDDDVTVQMVEEWRDAVLAQCRNVVPYSVNAHDYIWLRKFGERQKIRYQIESKLPEPTEDSIAASGLCGNSRESSANKRSYSVGLGSVDVEKGSVDSSPPKSGKPARKPNSEAVKAHWQITKCRLKDTAKDAIDRLVGGTDTEKWTEVCEAWILRGFNPKNVAGMLEWFADGIPKGPRQQPPPKTKQQRSLDAARRVIAEEERKRGAANVNAR